MSETIPPFRLCPLPHPSRRNCWEAIKAAPDGYIVTIKAPKRSLEQNDKMWAMLGEVAKQRKWHNETLTPENWKDMFTAGLKGQKVVPGLEGGFVVLGTSTRRMSVKDMTELIEFITWWGSQPETFVKFKNIEREDAA